MEDGAKRKLPAWMSRTGITSNTAGPSEPEKGMHIEVHMGNNLNDVNSSQSLHPKSKRKEKVVKKDNKANETPDYEPKKRKRKTLNQGEGKSNVIEDNNGGIKKKNKRRERSHERSKETDSPSGTEDDEELTVEDLLTIAQEYVRRDDNLGKQHLANEYHDWKTNPDIAFSVPPQSNKEPPMSEEAVPDHNSIVRTEDPAQDMLDLFLGPLLKQPVSEDNLIKTTEEDKGFVRELKEQVHDNTIAMADFVPLTKKKTSLKDKVTMFFD